MKNNYFILLTVLLFTVVEISAQKTTSLSQAINAAFNNRKFIQAGKIDITIQQLKTKVLNKKYGPQLHIDYNYNYNPILQSSIIPVGKFNSALPIDATERIQFGTTWSQFAGITATQPLYDATIKRQINESRLQERISNAFQAQTEYELGYEVSKAYINIWLQEQEINEATIDTTRTWISYQLQLDNYLAGRLLKSELNSAIINHNNSRLQLADAEIQLAENKIYLLFLTGMFVSETDDFKIDTSTFNKKDFSLVDSRITLDSVPVFQQLKLQGQLSLLQKQTEKSKYLPVVSLKGFLGANQFSNDFNPIKSNSWFGYSFIGLNVKFPLLLAEGKKNKTEQLQLEAQQYNKQLEDKSSQFNQESATTKLELTRLNFQLKTQEDNIILYQETLKILQERFKEQQTTSNEINRQENELQKLLAAHQNTKVKAWLFRLSYLNSSGQLSRLWK